MQRWERRAHTIAIRRRISLCTDPTRPTLHTASHPRWQDNSPGQVMAPFQIWFRHPPLWFAQVSPAKPCPYCHTAYTPHLYSRIHHSTAHLSNMHYIHAYPHSLSVHVLVPLPQLSRTSYLPVMVFWTFWFLSSHDSKQDICFRN